MKITGIRATAVAVPVRHPRVRLWYQRTHVPRTIVEVETDAGIAGIGETRGRWSAATINDRLRPRLIGLDPLDRAAAWTRCVSEPEDFGFPEDAADRLAYAGIELALWDIAGKAAGKPVYDLLGGKLRDAADFAAYGYPIDPEGGIAEAAIPDTLAALAAESVARSGARLYEFKIGRHPVDIDIATVKAVRAALGPGVAIHVDANMNYTMDEARRFLAGVADANLGNFEEPVESLSDIETLRTEFGVPVSTHCTRMDVVRRFPRIDSVVSDPPYHGGIHGIRGLMRDVAAAGRGFWLRSTWELGISWAAVCHLGVACREITRGAQGLLDLVGDDLVLGEPWSVRNGAVVPLPRPGLGIDLDRPALARFAVSSGV
ncbi:MAG: mandelate racemase/muconate lactonizing enzyme family protein [Alphaproteobacteria bacterium]|nr:mandelate racemase/muconate lactonizing enzyme family protein [Alphaproteobacteria bacterium]